MNQFLPTADELRATQKQQQQSDESITKLILGRIAGELKKLMDARSNETSLRFDMATYTPSQASLKSVQDALEAAGYVVSNEYPSNYPGLSAVSKDLAQDGIQLTINDKFYASSPVLTIRWGTALDVRM